MCNLNSVTSSRQAPRDPTRVTRDSTGNLPPLPGIFPGQSARRPLPDGALVMVARGEKRDR